MRIFILLGLLLMVFIVHPADADIYKYRDVQGVIRYTYDLAEVPEDQRPQVQTYEEAALAPEPASEKATGNSEVMVARPKKKPKMLRSSTTRKLKS